MTTRPWSKRMRRSSSWSTPSSSKRSKRALRTFIWNRWPRHSVSVTASTACLHEMKSPPKRLQASIISRLKIQSNMSIAEKRIPQDGRIQAAGRRQDDRSCACPACRRTMAKASSCVFWTRKDCGSGLPELGFFTDDQQTFERLIGLPDGILLVTGPDRFRQNDDALFLSELHQPAGPQDHHGGRPGRIPAGRHQPGAGAAKTIGFTFARPCARCSARRPT